MGKPKPPSPDPAIGEAAKENGRLGREQLDFAKKQYEEGKGRQATIDEFSKKFADQQLSDSQFNSEQARDQWANYKDTFQPLEKQMAAEAASYDSAGRADTQANAAGATVTKAFDDAQESQARMQGRMGINPMSGRSQAASNAIANQRALGEAGAQTSARDNVAKMGIMLRKDAAGFGRGMTGTAAQAFGVASNAGSSGSGALMGANGQFMAGANGMNAGFGGAMSGNTSMMNGLSQQYQNQMSSYNANAHKYDGLMKAAGAVGGAFMGNPEAFGMSFGV